MPSARYLIGSKKQLTEADLPESLVHDLITVTSEIGSNIQRHAYDQEDGQPPHLAVTIDDHPVTLRFVDEGPPFDLKSYSPDEKEVLSEGGMGINLVRELIDEIQYDRHDNENHLVISVNYS